MLTPLDLTNKQFKKKIVGGYRRDEVNEFLDKVIEDFQKLYKENIELKDKINVLNEALQHYKGIEESLQNSLVSAQQTAEEIKKNAYEKSEVIVKEAEMRAQKIIADANHEIMRIKYEYEENLKKFNVFKKKIEMLLTSQLEMMKDVEEELEE